MTIIKVRRIFEDAREGCCDSTTLSMVNELLREANISARFETLQQNIHTEKPGEILRLEVQ